MKLVIEVKKEDYKRYKEDKICSYTSAVLDAVPLNEVLDKIRAEIDEKYDRVHPYNISCAEGLEMALDIIDKYWEENK